MKTTKTVKAYKKTRVDSISYSRLRYHGDVLSYAKYAEARGATNA